MTEPVVLTEVTLSPAQPPAPVEVAVEVKPPVVTLLKPAEVTPVKPTEVKPMVPVAPEVVPEPESLESSLAL